MIVRSTPTPQRTLTAVHAIATWGVIPPSATMTLRAIIAAVSSGSYEEAIAHAHASRLSPDDLARAVSATDESFVAPPFPAWDVVEITGPTCVGWSVRAPLYNADEQDRSDWELHFTITVSADKPRVEIDSLLIP